MLCIDMLTPEKYSPTIKVHDSTYRPSSIVLTELVRIIANPDDKGAANAAIASEWKSNRALFNKKCADWAKGHPA